MENLDKTVDNVFENIQMSQEHVEVSLEELDKLNSIGGLSSIVPSEGIVFKYKGKTYKFTGAFAPVNQIVGLLNF